MNAWYHRLTRRQLYGRRVAVLVELHGPEGIVRPGTPMTILNKERGLSLLGESFEGSHRVQLRYVNPEHVVLLEDPAIDPFGEGQPD